jgi:hypothetical protein
MNNMDEFWIFLEYYFLKRIYRKVYRLFMHTLNTRRTRCVFSFAFLVHNASICLIFSKFESI